jgi:hypothetical protein
MSCAYGEENVFRFYHDRFLPNPFEFAIRPSVLYILSKRQGRKTSHNKTDLLLSISLNDDFPIFTFLTERL